MNKETNKPKTINDTIKNALYRTLDLQFKKLDDINKRLQEIDKSN